MMLTVTLYPQLSGLDRLAAWQDVMSATGEVHVADLGALVETLQSKEVGNLLSTEDVWKQTVETIVAVTCNTAASTCG